MKISDIALLEWWKSYLTDKKKYIKHNDNIVYTWVYILHNDIQYIQANVSNDIIENFTIPVVYNTHDRYRWNRVEISREIYDKLYYTLSESILHDDNVYNYLTVEMNSCLHKIHYFLHNTLYDNFILLFDSDSKQQLYQWVKDFYNDIENILVEDISGSIKQYKEDNNMINFFNKELTKIKNPIIKESLDNISAAIHTFVLQLDNRTKTNLLSHPHRKGRSRILQQSKKYLMERYHSNELKHLKYNEAVEMLDDSIDQIYSSLNPKSTKESDSKEYIYVEQLRKQISEYIIATQKNITQDMAQDVLEDIIHEVVQYINGTVFDELIRWYYDLDQFEDTGYYSRELSEDVSNIRNYVEECLLHYQNYKYVDLSLDKNNTIIESPRDVFHKIRWLYQEWDNDNLIHCIKKIQTYEDKEIRDFLSNNELKELLGIIIKKEEYEFAARVKKLIH